MLICGSCFRHSKPDQKIKMLTTPQKVLSGGGWVRCPTCRIPMTEFDDTYIQNAIDTIKKGQSRLR